jgi:glycosyltransferase involved in cell wall biosynthesis
VGRCHQRLIRAGPPCASIAARPQSCEGSAAIRVLLTHPYGWPHVRRGAEREVHELAGRLVAEGHDARVLTGRPAGAARRGVVEGAPVRYVRTLRRSSWPEPGPGFSAAALGASLLTRPDVVHCLHYADAAGAARGRAPVVLKLTGSVLPSRVAGLDARLLRSALERSAEVWVNSAWALEQMAGFGMPMRVVPAGLDTTKFVPGPRSPHPLVVCAAASDEPRKRVADLVACWPAVRQALPGAELVLAGSSSTRLPEGATSVGVLGDAELAALYARAWVVVAPALYEALGLVTLEALASGTPVAGADSGATSELLSAPGVGALADPGSPEALADAVLRAAALSQQPGTAETCRAVSLRYDWSSVLPLVQQGYARVLAARA